VFIALSFSKFVNDIENIFVVNGVEGIHVDVNIFKMFLILHTDDFVIFANTSDELQTSLNLFNDYCQRWKLTVNVKKTRILILRKGGKLSKSYVYYGVHDFEKFV